MLKEFYNDGWVTVLQGNTLDILKELPEESMQTVVTSSPYFWLRIHYHAVEKR